MKAATASLALAVLANGAAATWCNFFYDAACTHDSNGGTSYNCADGNRFGSGGGFARCHAQNPDYSDPCDVSRWNQQMNGERLGAVIIDIPAGASDSACTDLDGAGPWIGLSIAG